MQNKTDLTTVILKETQAYLKNFSSTISINTNAESSFSIHMTELHVAIARGEMLTCKTVLHQLNEEERAIILNGRIENGEFHRVKSIQRGSANPEIEFDWAMMSRNLEIPEDFTVELSLVLAVYSEKFEMVQLLIQYGVDIKQVCYLCLLKLKYHITIIE